MMGLAADEIERLRAEVARLATPQSAVLQDSAVRDAWEAELIDILEDAQGYVEAFTHDKEDGHLAKSLSERIDLIIERAALRAPTDALKVAK